MSNPWETKNPWGKGSKEWNRWMEPGEGEEKEVKDQITNEFPLTEIEEDVSGVLRILFWGGARTSGDNSTFYFAMKNVNKAYKDAGVAVFAESASFIVSYINKQKPGSIASVDFFAHGSPSALYLVRDSRTGKPGGITHTIEEKYVESNNLYASKMAYSWESWGGGDDTDTIRSIFYENFANNAKIEVHGCRAAQEYLWYDNIACNLTEGLSDAGRVKAVAIGHQEKANPNILGSGTENNQQDYRHGIRIVYHDQEVLFRTKVKGHISQTVIQSYIQKKLSSNDYSGESEWYKL